MCMTVEKMKNFHLQCYLCQRKVLEPCSNLCHLLTNPCSSLLPRLSEAASSKPFPWAVEAKCSPRKPGHRSRSKLRASSRLELTPDTRTHRSTKSSSELIYPVINKHASTITHLYTFSLFRARMGWESCPHLLRPSGGCSKINSQDPLPCWTCPCPVTRGRAGHIA